MKKLLIIFALAAFCNVIAIAQSSPNPVVKRLSQQEIASCKTPAALAYNYVLAILNRDYNRAMSYMTAETAQKWREVGTSVLDKEFSTPGKLNIHGWKPALSEGYEIAVLYIQDEGEYEGQMVKKIYVGCVPSSEINVSGFQDITRYDYETNVKVLVLSTGRGWKVAGFK